MLKTVVKGLFRGFRIVWRWTAFRTCAFACVALAGACAAFKAAPAPIPADQVLDLRVDKNVAMGETMAPTVDVAAAGGDQLRGFLSDE